MKKARNGFIKSLHYFCLIGVIALGLMTIVGTTGDGGDGDGDGGTCVNVAGTWNTTEVVDATDCGEGTYTEYNTYTATQDDCNITVTTGGVTFSGTVNGSQVSFTVTYSVGGGTETLTGNLTFSGDNFTGSGSWTWSDGSATCSGTTQITGTRTDPGSADTASVRFFNDLNCADDPFTATLNVDGTSLNSQTGSWSSCETVAPGTYSISLNVTTICGTIEVSGSTSFDSDSVYDFILGMDGSNIALFMVKTSPGDCSTATPGASVKSLYDDDRLELLMEVPIEGKGFTSAQ